MPGVARASATKSSSVTARVGASRADLAGGGRFREGLGGPPTVGRSDVPDPGQIALQPWQIGDGRLVPAEPATRSTAPAARLPRSAAVRSARTSRADPAEGRGRAHRPRIPPSRGEVGNGVGVGPAGGCEVVDQAPARVATTQVQGAGHNRGSGELDPLTRRSSPREHRGGQLQRYTWIMMEDDDPFLAGAGRREREAVGPALPVEVHVEVDPVARISAGHR